MNKDKIKELALDLNVQYPRSPRALLAGYVIIARTLDKCRALLNGTIGEYHYDCPLDNEFFGFAGLEAGPFKEFVADGADDEAVADWITRNATPRPRLEIIKWNNRMRDIRISELPDPRQEFLEGYIPKIIPPNRRVYTWFDVYDIEEGRL